MLFKSVKTVRKPNLAETLLNNTNTTADARKKRIAEFVPVLVEYMATEAIAHSKGDNNKPTIDFELWSMINGEKKVQSIVDRFLVKSQVPLPNLAEINEIVPLIKAALEEPNKYGFVVVTENQKIRLDWSTPVVPPEPPKEEPKVEVPKPEEPKSEPKPEPKVEVVPEPTA